MNLSGALLSELLETASAVPSRDLEELDAELYALSRAHASLLGVEHRSKRDLELRMHRLRAERKLAGSYKRLSTEPLGWSRGRWRPRPVFALFALNDSVMVIDGQEGITRPESLPKALKAAYQPAIARLDPLQKITTPFVGVIPTAAKQQIAQALPDFQSPDAYGTTRDNLYLLAEAVEWGTVQKPVEPAKWPSRVREALSTIDPLVVGWDGNDLWLVTHFNLTPLERYLMDEFPALFKAPSTPQLSDH